MVTNGTQCLTQEDGHFDIDDQCIRQVDGDFDIGDQNISYGSMGFDRDLSINQSNKADLLTWLYSSIQSVTPWSVNK